MLNGSSILIKLLPDPSRAVRALSTGDIFWVCGGRGEYIAGYGAKKFRH